MDEREPMPKAERVPDEALLSTIEPIGKGGIIPKTREDLAMLVEAPLLDACQELYDLNIQTSMSGANAGDVLQGHVHLMIDFDSLSEENKAVAREFGGPRMVAGVSNCVTLTFPVGPETTVGDVRRMAHEAVLKFHKQEMSWAKGKTIKEMAEPYGSDGEGWGPDSFPDHHYDAATGLFYQSEEQYKKVNNLV